MKYAVVGTGYWGKNHVRVAAELQDQGRLDELVICDADEERVSELARSYGIEYTTDWTTIDADAATIATPSPTHREIATALLETGVDLLVEKPLALTAEDAWGIVETANEYDRTLGVGHIFRYHPAVRELKRRIVRGELGQIKYLHTNRFSFRVPRETTGVLYSLAVHDVDIYEFLLDQRPNTVYCQCDSHLRENIAETATLTLEYGAATGVINASWQIPVFGKERHLIAVGTERTGYIDYLSNNELELYDAEVSNDGGQLRSQSEGAITYEVGDREPLKAEVKDFLDARERNDQPVANGTVGAHAVGLLDRAAAADAAGEVMSLSSDGSDLGYDSDS